MVTEAAFKFSSSLCSFSLSGRWMEEGISCSHKFTRLISAPLSLSSHPSPQPHFFFFPSFPLDPCLGKGFWRREKAVLVLLRHNSLLNREAKPLFYADSERLRRSFSSFLANKSNKKLGKIFLFFKK